MRRLLLAALLLVLAVLPAHAATTAVDIRGSAYVPPALTVTVGDTVEWTNGDRVLHTVTADDGSFGSGNLLPGRTFPRRYDTVGTFPFHCEIHESTMKGTVVVQAAAAGTTTTTTTAVVAPADADRGDDPSNAGPAALAALLLAAVSGGAALAVKRGL